MMMKPEDYGYVVKNNLCLFQKGPLSQWWGGFKGQNGGFEVQTIDLFRWYIQDHLEPQNDNGSLLDNISGKYKHLHFNCCEQWMMACKAILFNDGDTFKKIMDETSPKQQKDLGRIISNYDQETWDYYKYDIVLEGNLFKFENEELREFLMSFNLFTIFAEASPWDKVWGIGLGPDDPKALDIHTWEGENLLGKVISRVRQIYEDDID